MLKPEADGTVVLCVEGLASRLVGKPDALGLRLFRARPDQVLRT